MLAQRLWRKIAHQAQELDTSILGIILSDRIWEKELSKLNVLNPLRRNRIFLPGMSLKKSTKDTSRSFWRSILKRSTMAERFSIGRELEISLTIKPISF
jgi:hypothetical protein